MKRVFVEEGTSTSDDALGISRAKVVGIIEHARIFDAREANNVRDASNATDDGMISILEDAGDDAVRRELMQLIRDMDVDEQSALVALAWIGRGTYSGREWSDALTEARQVHNSHTAEYLLGLPLLASYLDTGLAELDAVSAEDAAKRFTA